MHRIDANNFILILSFAFCYFSEETAALSPINGRRKLKDSCIRTPQARSVLGCPKLRK
jgi:hypothetical protein